ncbi:hypothetical protein PENTCL1PPCAC_10292 [Pristionchus entomophagus]|uniref:BZIP domain-containing protein n=1 Tax=Pristionchus entomophagus TaxID=358040 RepID=A0AAV5SZH6_9BILA|nr:hypothetical protein PENTCL1PPCAC_10292 [Pristionchus entomophagus]
MNTGLSEEVNISHPTDRSINVDDKNGRKENRRLRQRRIRCTKGYANRTEEFNRLLKAVQVLKLKIKKQNELLSANKTASLIVSKYPSQNHQQTFFPRSASTSLSSLTNSQLVEFWESEVVDAFSK